MHIPNENLNSKKRIIYQKISRQNGLIQVYYKYLILIISQYLIFTYAMKVNESIDKILLVNIFMVFLIDLIMKTMKLNTCKTLLLK